MALVCAAIGCPPLRTEPYVGKRLDAQLDDQTRIFVADEYNAEVYRANNRIYLSSIFKWFGDDFIKTYGNDKRFSDYKKSQAAVLSFLSKFISPEDMAYVVKEKPWVEFQQYSWVLNEQPQQEK